MRHQVLIKFVLLSLLLGGCSIFSKSSFPDKTNQPKALKRILRRFDTIEEGAEVERISKVLRRLSQTDPHFVEKFKVYLINAKEPQAYAFSSYEIVLTRGLLDLTLSEEELCVIMLHEMAHVYFKHTIEHRFLSYGATTLSFLGRSIINLASFNLFQGLGGFNYESEVIADSLHYLNSTVLTKQQEIEADRWAMTELKRRSMSPHYARKILEKLAHYYKAFLDQNKHENEMMGVRLQRISSASEENRAHDVQ